MFRHSVKSIQLNGIETVNWALSVAFMQWNLFVCRPYYVFRRHGPFIGSQAYKQIFNLINILSVSFSQSSELRWFTRLHPDYLLQLQNICSKLSHCPNKNVQRSFAYCNPFRNHCIFLAVSSMKWTQRSARWIRPQRIKASVWSRANHLENEMESQTFSLHFTSQKLVMNDKMGVLEQRYGFRGRVPC